jgi:hypothetical protein
MPTSGPRRVQDVCSSSALVSRPVFHPLQAAKLTQISLSAHMGPCGPQRDGAEGALGAALSCGLDDLLRALSRQRARGRHRAAVEEAWLDVVAGE